MLLTPTEMERLTIYVAAELARKHKAKGLPLNHPEAVAFIVDEILEGAREGRSVADLIAWGSTLLTSDVDERDRPFLTGERTPEGFFRIQGGLDAAIARGLAYAPYADLLWCETSEPNLFEAKRFADAIHAQFPGKLLAYNCSPSFNWEKKLDAATIARFQKELASMGYRFQFVTLAGFHALNHSMFELARAYRHEGMSAYSRLQQAEFASEKHGYSATRHQREVGTGYFDDVANVIAAGQASTTALAESTESAQF